MSPTQSPNFTLMLIVAIVFIVMLIGFSLMWLQYYRRRKNKLIEEKEALKASYEQTLLQAQLEIQEQTLRKISHEIHDNIGQLLSLASINLETLSAPNLQKLGFTTALVNKALSELRDLSKSLNPERVIQVGIAEAIGHELAQLEKTGYRTSLLIEEHLQQLPPDKVIILYRMIQEAINNIIKHAKASEVRVQIVQENDATILSIADDGIGFPVNENTSSGIGLQNLRYRSAMIDAETTIESSPGNGTTVRFIFKSIA
jgi:signal transduction histidine kinase